MKKMASLLASCLLLCMAVVAAPATNYHVLIAPATVTANAATILWDKQAAKAPIVYQIWLNNKPIATTTTTNYTIAHLLPSTAYKVSVTLATNKDAATKTANTIGFTTKAVSKVINIVDFGAKADSQTVNTKAIQAAINACSKGGTVLVPKGVYMSGALYLKSDMTLFIEKGAVLKGSTVVEDYLPMLLNRFEGWELTTYASLINAGTLNRDGSYNVKNVRITGGGTIAGGGKRLGDAMIKAKGMRSRGRLICLMNSQDVCISDLTITEPPCWTIHYIYSDNVTCQNLNIITFNIRNGDGIDPDSSTDSYIFNCTFDTGDDCIAIKSGKNPEGFYVAKPTTNVRITDCDFKRGHGISIGSEMSGGVSDVLVQDCKAGALLHGMQIKGTKERGGYIKNVTVTDCELMQITVFSALNYNNDGEAAPTPPNFENFVFKNIDLTKASTKEPVININGFKDADHKLKNVRFSNIVLPSNAKVLVNDGVHIVFEKVATANGIKPDYVLNNSSDIVY